ncbi:hypothetical protein ABH313_01325 [Chromobacterium vaccinii]|uniref:hypothetical protein n=1 Tax=Chromobacterium vaccinii TaxID=1108595 RepID=UPI003261219F
METGDIGGLAAASLGAMADAARIRPGGWLLASDVEGPLFLGDFIAEALSACLAPAAGGIDAAPSYGQILYAEGYAAFSADTEASRRPEGAGRRETRPEGGYTLAQEGTDTIFALPLLLAAGADYACLERLALGSPRHRSSLTGRWPSGAAGCRLAGCWARRFLCGRPKRCCAGLAAGMSRSLGCGRICAMPTS